MCVMVSKQRTLLCGGGGGGVCVCVCVYVYVHGVGGFYCNRLR